MKNGFYKSHLVKSGNMFVLITGYSTSSDMEFQGVVLNDSNYFKSGFYSKEWNKEEFVLSSIDEFNDLKSNQ